MFDDGVADRASASGDDVEVVGGQAALVDEQGGEGDGAQGRLRRRLEDDGATGGDRRSELVGDEVEGEVERRDRPDDTDRNAHGEPDLALAGGDRIEGDDLTGERAGLGGGELERPDGALRFDPCRADRLGSLGCNRPGELLLAFAEQAGRCVEDLGPLPPRQGASLQRLPCRRDGAVDVVGGGQRHSADLGPVERRVDDDLFAAHGSDHTSGMAARHPYLDWPGPVALAHRGGAADAPENTMQAFAHAVSLGYRYLETDVRVTADGVVVVFHDEDLSRLCGRPGRIADLRAAEVATARVHGTEPIPTLDELLDAWPEARLNIDCKSEDGARPLVDVITRHDALDRVCLTSFSDRRVRSLRRMMGRRLCTAAGTWELAVLKLIGLSGAAHGSTGSRSPGARHRRQFRVRPPLPPPRHRCSRVDDRRRG